MDSDAVEESTAEARDHYVDVGYTIRNAYLPLIALTMARKSKLRKPNGVDLGPRYTGASISRDALGAEDSDDDPFARQSEQGDSESAEYADPDEDLEPEASDVDEEIESDDAFESGDDEKFASFTFRESGRLGVGENQMTEADDAEDGDSEGEDIEDGFNGFESAVEEDDSDSDDVDMDDDEDATEGGSDETSISDGTPEPKADDRAALRKMMAEEQKTVAASLSKAAKADVAKGQAIKRQRMTFDSLLNTRIKLQKALIATNSMDTSAAGSNDHPKAIEAAEKAALRLWNTISDLRSSLQPSTSKNPPPHPSTSPSHSNPSPTLWQSMQSHETVTVPNRRSILTKWSQKTNPTTALPRTGKFSQTPSQQPLTSVLDQHLSGPNAEKLLERTQIPRSCAPIQASSSSSRGGIASDPAIYDDADFYTLLLRELVDQRMADPTNTTSRSGGALPLNSSIGGGVGGSRQSFNFKVMKKPVDTKASKGRKMRYTVHEKLQNFMAPEDVGSWGERQRAELFGSLFGRKVGLGEEDEEDDNGEEGEGVEREDNDGGGGGLRLFG